MTSSYQGIGCGRRSRLSSREPHHTRKLRWGRYFRSVDLGLTSNLWLVQNSCRPRLPRSFDQFRVPFGCSRSELPSTERRTYHGMDRVRDSRRRWYDDAGSGRFFFRDGCDTGRSSWLVGVLLTSGCCVRFLQEGIHPVNSQPRSLLQRSSVVNSQLVHRRGKD